MSVVRKNIYKKKIFWYSNFLQQTFFLIKREEEERRNKGMEEGRKIRGKRKN